jgi:phosphoglycolate phosphatase-like HAD superfamily hydrolase
MSYPSIRDHPSEREDRAPIAILFDIDGCLISTGGAGTRSWRRAFESLHGVPADIGEFTEAGMTDPEVGRLTFARVLGREPTDREMARLLGAYLGRLATEVAQSPGYRVMPGVSALLPRLVDTGILLGIVSGALEGAAHIKLARADLNRFFCFGGYGSDSRDRSELTRRAIERAGAVHGHALDPKRVLVVGDTPRDIAAAHAAGAVAIGVATGKYPVEALRAAGADHALPTLEHPLPGVPDAPGEARTDERVAGDPSALPAEGPRSLGERPREELWEEL